MKIRPALVMGALAISVLAGCAPVSLPPPTNRVVNYDAGISATLCAPAASSKLGEHCRCAADCADPTSTCLTEETSFFPQGLCAGNCINGKPCGPGQGCSDTVCYLNCATTADCPPQSFCALGKCTPFCQSNDDCLSGNCDTYIGHCLAPGVVSEGLGLDLPCSNGADCRSSICQDGHCTTPCSVTGGHCPENGVCISAEGDLGRCFLPCTLPETCAGNDRRCTVLQPGMPAACLPTSHIGCTGVTPSPTAGHTCGCNDDCDVGTICLDEKVSGYPHGVCTILCHADADCPASTSCYQALCLPKCTTDATCEASRLCGFGICGPYCVSDSECATGKCDLYDGLCEATPTTGGGVGATCSNNAACKSKLCDTSAHSDGFCITYCSTQRGACPDDAVCLRGTPTSDSGFCVRKCNTVADCPQQTGSCVSGGAGQPKHCL